LILNAYLIEVEKREDWIFILYHIPLWGSISISTNIKCKSKCV